MKKLYLISLILLLCSNIFNVAGAFDQTDPPPIQEVPENGNDGIPDKKRKPAIHQYIGVCYDNINNVCTFIIPVSISNLSVTLESENGVTTGFVSSDYPVWHVDLTPGIYNILCTSDDGRVFEGDIVI